MSNSPPPPQPARVLWVAMVGVTILGLLVSLELARLHAHAHEAGAAPSLCAINAAFDCDAVARSSWSVALGLPVAWWGVASFLALLGLAVAALVSTSAVPGLLFFGLSSLAAVGSVALATISVVIIHSTCLYCAAVHVLNIAAAVSVGWYARQLPRSVRSELLAFCRRRWMVLAAGAVAVVGVWLLLVRTTTKYWARADAPSPSWVLKLSRGWTSEHHPWIGAAEPVLTITEISDYECPYCQRAHQRMRELLTSYPDRLRVVHLHYPLDPVCNRARTKPLHERACSLATLAVCAGEQDRFWQADDWLFEHASDPEAPDVARISAAIGLDRTKMVECVRDRATAVIARDVEEGIRLKIPGTPTFVVGSDLYPGGVPEKVLRVLGSPQTTGSASASH